MKLSRRGLLGALFAAPLAGTALAHTRPRLTQLPAGTRILPRGPVHAINGATCYQAQIRTDLDGSTMEFSTTEKFTCGQRVTFSMNGDVAFTGTVKRVELDLTGERIPYHVYAEDDTMFYPHVRLDAQMTRELASQIGDEMLRTMKQGRRFV